MDSLLETNLGICNTSVLTLREGRECNGAVVENGGVSGFQKDLGQILDKRLKVLLATREIEDTRYCGKRKALTGQSLRVAAKSQWTHLERLTEILWQASQTAQNTCLCLVGCYGSPEVSP